MRAPFAPGYPYFDIRLYSQFCDSIIRIAYHTAIYKYGYTIIHGCDGDGFSYQVTDHDATRKKATAAEKKRMAGTIMESGK